MQAAMRLFITADRKRLVAEGHPDGAFLYAAPGDEIPESAAEMFSLVEGRIDADAKAEEIEGILRVATIDGGSIEVAGFTFTSEWREFGAGQLDEGQLLEILKEPALTVEGALLGDQGGWISFPGRDFVIERLQGHVEYDVLHGRAHDPIALRTDYVAHPADVERAAAEEAARKSEADAAAALEKEAFERAEAHAAAGSTAPTEGTSTETQEPPVEKPSTPAPAKESVPAKEAKPAPNKEAKPAANKAKGQ